VTDLINNDNIFAAGTFETVTITITGTYDIVALGAEGGSAGGVAGGLGADSSGDIVLTAGEQLEIVAGAAGANAKAGNGAAVAAEASSLKHLPAPAVSISR
jgi:hypothetical protein